MSPASFAVFYGIALALAARDRAWMLATAYRLRRCDRLIEAGHGREARRVMRRLRAEAAFSEALIG